MRCVEKENAHDVEGRMSVCDICETFRNDMNVFFYFKEEYFYLYGNVAESLSK